MPAVEDMAGRGWTPDRRSLTMSFVSLTFFLFLPLVFALHWLRRDERWQNGVLVVASYVFYGWWDWRFCSLILVSSLIDYAVGLGLAQARNLRGRRWLVGLSVVSNLGILGFFKYFNFFLDSLVIALAGVGIDLPPAGLNVILPIGISFYTFQTMSYTLDVYHGRFVARRSLLDYLTFVSFFPQLVAGPIERASSLLPQFERRRKFDERLAREGLRFIVWGLVKKMLVADNLGGFVDSVYVDPGQSSPAELGLATVAFAFQIYGDFSGYSDIAVGVARLFGIRLRRNFAYPYFSRSVTEFWRRWHISLSSWFRDYVFIPLGGSRGTRSRTSGNLLATALISGLWHGAAWHFVAWGCAHGLALVAERRLRGGKSLAAQSRMPMADGWASGGRAWASMAATFVFTCLAWVLFRADNLGEAVVVYRALVVGCLSPSSYPELLELLYVERWRGLCVVGMVGAEWFGRGRWNPLSLAAWPLPLRWTVYTLLFWLLLAFGTRGTADFIYFQF